jgi:hypothetical protein
VWWEKMQGGKEREKRRDENSLHLLRCVGVIQITRTRVFACVRAGSLISRAHTDKHTHTHTHTHTHLYIYPYVYMYITYMHTYRFERCPRCMHNR